jgi:hypothetical protein
MGLFSGPAKKELTVDDIARRERLDKLTATARVGMSAFSSVGAALDAIRTEELWRLVAGTWEQWCEAALGLSERRVAQLIDASRTCRTLTQSGLKPPTSERAVRELAGLPPEKQVEVWQEATTVAGDAEPTAEVVAKAAQKRRPRKPGRTKVAKPVSLRVPGAAVRVVPRKNGWVGLVAALEHALEVARQREQEGGEGHLEAA